MAKIFFDTDSSSPTYATAYNTNGSVRTGTQGGSLTGMLSNGNNGILVLNATIAPIRLTLTCGANDTIITSDPDDSRHGRNHPHSVHGVLDIEGNAITVHIPPEQTVRFFAETSAAGNIVPSRIFTEGHTAIGIEGGYDFISILKYQ